MSSSPPPATTELALTSDAESQLSSLIYDLSQSVQDAMGNMLKMIKEIDQNSDDIVAEIEKFKDSLLRRKTALEEDRDQFQKAALAILDMLK